MYLKIWILCFQKLAALSKPDIRLKYVGLHLKFILFLNNILIWLNFWFSSVLFLFCCVNGEMLNPKSNKKICLKNFTKTTWVNFKLVLRNKTLVDWRRILTIKNVYSTTNGFTEKMCPQICCNFSVQLSSSLWHLHNIVWKKYKQDPKSWPVCYSYARLDHLRNKKLFLSQMVHFSFWVTFTSDQGLLWIQIQQAFG